MRDHELLAPLADLDDERDVVAARHAPRSSCPLHEGELAVASVERADDGRARRGRLARRARRAAGDDGVGRRVGDVDVDVVERQVARRIVDGAGERRVGGLRAVGRRALESLARAGAAAARSSVRAARRHPPPLPLPPLPPPELPPLPNFELFPSSRTRTRPWPRRAPRGPRRKEHAWVPPFPSHRDRRAARFQLDCGRTRGAAPTGACRCSRGCRRRPGRTRRPPPRRRPGAGFAPPCQPPDALLHVAERRDEARRALEVLERLLGHALHLVGGADLVAEGGLLLLRPVGRLQAPA